MSLSTDKTQSSSSFKREREQKRQEQAGLAKDAVAAKKGSLFLRADAVMEGVAERLGVSRGELMDVENANSGDLAVRLALGEAEQIEQTKSALMKAGVDVEKLEKAAAVSKTNVWISQF